MKNKFLKIVLSLTLFALLITLSGCKMSRANVYNYWKNGDSDILPKDHIVEEVSLSKLEKMVSKQSSDSDEVIYVFYGAKSESNNQTAIKIFNDQAVQFEISTLYWLSSDLSDKKKDELGEKLGVAKTSTTGVLYAFEKGKITFDSSRAYYSNNTSTYSNVVVAQIAFRHLYDENGEYSYTD